MMTEMTSIIFNALKCNEPSLNKDQIIIIVPETLSFSFNSATGFIVMLGNPIQLIHIKKGGTQTRNPKYQENY